jgi:hypothetical protein
MLTFAIAALLMIQDASPEPAAPDADPQAQAEPAPTDAASLIAQIDGQYDSYVELVAELAARRARERYLTSLMLPVIGRTDLEDDARARILQSVGGRISQVQSENAAWAVRQLDPEFFPILYAEAPDLADAVLLWAERDASAEPAIVAALEPVALAGAYDAQTFAERADRSAMARGRRQIYGTQTVCVDGREEIAPLGRVYMAEQRELLGLPPLDVDAFQGEACEDTGAEGDSE